MIDALRIVPVDPNIANDTMTADLLGTLIKAQRSLIKRKHVEK